MAVQSRLDHKRITQQRQQRTEIRQRIEPVGRPARQRLAEPGLDQRPGRREDEIGQADTNRQQRQDSRGRIIAIRRLPPVGRRDRQRQQRRADQRQMDDRPHPGPEIVLAQVGVGITGEQDRLKKQQAGGPDGRTAAEPGENEPADQRLHLKQQKSAEKDRAGVKHGQS